MNCPSWYHTASFLFSLAMSDLTFTLVFLQEASATRLEINGDCARAKVQEF